MIQRRHVYFVGGYHPLNIAGYHTLFRRQLERFERLWGAVSETTSHLIADDGMSGSWDCQTVGPDWTVTTNYVVLRWDDVVSSDMQRGNAVRIVAIAKMLFLNIVNGQLASLFRINWRFTLAYLYPIFGLLILTSAPFAIGASVSYATYRLTESPIWSISMGGVLAMLGIPIGLFLARRTYILQMADAWIWANEWSQGRRADIDLRIEIFAEKILRQYQSDTPDEVLLIGHSCGTILITAIVARLLELDSSFASSSPEIAIVSVGTCSPVVACNPQANRFRSSIDKILSTPGLSWIEIQARKDVLGCCDFDPSSFRVDASAPESELKIVDIRLRDMLSTDFYTAHRLDYFRLHFQYIMANDCIAPYDYFKMICGPDVALASFRADSSAASMRIERAW